MRKLSIAVLIVGIAIAVALTGCGGGGGGGGGTINPPPPVTGSTIVKGTVMDNFASGARPVKDVIITLGPHTTNTDANGNFFFSLGPNVAVSSLFNTPSDAVFKVSTRLLDQTKYPQVSVFYRSIGYEQIAESGGAVIALPFEVYTAAVGTTSDLGVVTVQFNDPNNPPPVPF